jgi:hypothetical protein
VIYLLKGLIPLRMLAAIPYLKEFELNAHVLLLALDTEVGANMVVLELCMATILLIGAGCRTFYKLLHTEIELHPDHLATLRLWVPQSRYAKGEQLIALSCQLMTDVGHLAGVESVARSRSQTLRAEVRPFRSQAAADRE